MLILNRYECFWRGASIQISSIIEQKMGNTVNIIRGIVPTKGECMERERMSVYRVRQPVPQGVLRGW